ncbi:stage II sporulation protein M [Halorussus ruber]|uniref:stage II sporulation protein M n=1 Tax=Halorussus ruber TaxID=1126238 RepID=UPI0010928BCB|nr:stage II sporulation protein M [Halorussus ruber]
MSSETSADASAHAASALGDYLNHDDPVVRFASFWAVCAALFAAAWYVGYYLLPEGLLRSSTAASALPAYAGSVWAEFLTIFAWNLGVCLLVVAANTFRSVRTPLGYLVVVVNWVQGAVVWGTGSLAVETARFAPSLSVALGRSGVYELTAYVAVAVATRGVMIWHQRSGPRWREEFERTQSPRDWTISRREAGVLLAGLALLAVSNYREAVMIAEAVG